jgi:hypothetical protein
MGWASGSNFTDLTFQDDPTSFFRAITKLC